MKTHVRANGFAQISIVYEQQKIPGFFEKAPVSVHHPPVTSVTATKKKPADSFFADPVNFYLKQIGEYPLLTPDQEQTLAKQIQQGRKAAASLRQKNDSLSGNKREQLRKLIKMGDHAKETLTNSNLRLVVAVAKKYQNFGLSLLDLIQEGNIGLITAAEKYDPAKGTKFSTYAIWRIRAAIQRAIANQGQTIRIPVHQVEDVHKLRVIRSSLTQKLQQDPTPEEIAVEMGMSTAKVRDLLKLSAVPLSLEMPVGDSDRQSCLGDMIPDDCSLEATMEENLRKEKIRQALQTLTEKEATVIRMRFGVGYGRQYTLEEVGRVLHVTRERIRQIEKKAIVKLRRPSCVKKLSGLLS